MNEKSINDRLLSGKTVTQVCQCPSTLHANTEVFVIKSQTNYIGQIHKKPSIVIQY